MDRDNEIELIQTIQEKDRRIKELETINENITRELLSRTEKLSETLKEKQDDEKTYQTIYLALFKACQDIMATKEIKDPAIDLLELYIDGATEELNKEE